MSILDNIVSGKQSSTPRVLVCGPPGIGKSSFAAGFPKPLFIDAENRTDHLDVDRLVVSEWNDVLKCLKALTESEEHQTVVLDTIDAIEALIISHMCKEDGVETLNDYKGGWGAFKRPLQNQWKRLFQYTDKLRSQGKQIILLAHTTTYVYSPPDGKPYDQYILRLNKNSIPVVEDSMDLIGYADFKVIVKTEKNAKAGKAMTTGERAIKWKYNPAYPSKQGIPFADTTGLTYDDFTKAAKK